MLQTLHTPFFEILQHDKRINLRQETLSSFTEFNEELKFGKWKELNPRY